MYCQTVACSNSFLSTWNIMMEVDNTNYQWTHVSVCICRSGADWEQVEGVRWGKSWLSILNTWRVESGQGLMSSVSLIWAAVEVEVGINKQLDLCRLQIESQVWFVIYVCNIANMWEIAPAFRRYTNKSGNQKLDRGFGGSAMTAGLSSQKIQSKWL